MPPGPPPVPAPAGATSAAAPLVGKVACGYRLDQVSVPGPGPYFERVVQTTLRPGQKPSVESWQRLVPVERDASGSYSATTSLRATMNMAPSSSRLRYRQLVIVDATGTVVNAPPYAQRWSQLRPRSVRVREGIGGDLLVTGSLPRICPAGRVWCGMMVELSTLADDGSGASRRHVPGWFASTDVSAKRYRFNVAVDANQLRERGRAHVINLSAPMFVRAAVLREGMREPTMQTFELGDLEFPRLNPVGDPGVLDYSFIVGRDKHGLRRLHQRTVTMRAVLRNQDIAPSGHPWSYGYRLRLEAPLYERHGLSYYKERELRRPKLARDYFGPGEDARIFTWKERQLPRGFSFGGPRRVTIVEQMRSVPSHRYEQVLYREVTRAGARGRE